jgi:hypothetical protein
MPQLNAYLSDELFEALNRYVSDLNEGQPGANASRSSVTAAALRAFLVLWDLPWKTLVRPSYFTASQSHTSERTRQMTVCKDGGTCFFFLMRNNEKVNHGYSQRPDFTSHPT